ncbi:MAG TPA: GFA family protein [Gammaproteobacteria bacterium]|nr:GFA family protein [Gammaproteobacteria bacterium]
MAELIVHHGGCHCGAVAFEVEAPADIVATACNCSICEMSGFLHLIVAAEHFRLLRGQDALATYTFNTGTARHYFCKTCGIKSFYVPRSHPDGYSVNVHCLDRSTIRSIRVEDLDGRHWEGSVDSLRAALRKT